MICFHQKAAHISGIKANGKYIVKMGLPTKPGQRCFLFNCGGCEGCQVSRTQSWSYRMECQQMYYDASCMITLTYDTKHLPQYGSVLKSDVQDFFKRLRYYYPKITNLKYYATSEYGESEGSTLRPHYHACLFGVDFSHDREHFYSKGKNAHYISKQLTEIWGKGHAECTDLTAGSAGYCAGYSNKKIGGFRDLKDYETTDTTTGEIITREKEFALISQGLAKPFYQDFQSDIYNYDACYTRAGYRIAVPQYFDKMYALEQPVRFEKLKADRIERNLAPHLDKTPARIAVREKCAILKRKQQGNLGALRR